MKLLVVFALTLVLSHNTHAKWYEGKSEKIYVDLPSEWTSIDQTEFLPLTFLGPSLRRKGKNLRPVIIVTPIGEKGTTHPKNFEETYKTGRLLWLDKVGGKLIDFYESSKLSWKDASLVHSYGHLYSMGKNSFSEQSFYAQCKGRYYHLKTLVHQDLIQRFQKQVQGIVKSFNCQEKK